ncbi:hypothetical protein TSUD_221400 [Trifolium subterraneum]|uniref:Uncharacterized protein n=1 Tax=Trifolium subterraneum TaxID=3900 RepID=A0A2Z6NAI2_TRISU|nr:hypothetical protein TSUD_221400 [Trifolium subterraneum]
MVVAVIKCGKPQLLRSTLDLVDADYEEYGNIGTVDMVSVIELMNVDLVGND